MNIAIAVGLTALVIAGFFALAEVATRFTPRSELRRRAKREVVVTLKDGTTFTGILFASDRDCLVLRNAEAIGFGSDSRNAPVQGEAVLLRSNVAYLQAT